MRKSFLWVLFCILIVGCKPGLVPDPIPPIPIPAPIVNLDVPATAGYLSDITINWSSLNTTTVTKSFVDGVEVTGSFIVKAITKTTTFSITGQGAGGKTTVEKTVSVKIPTMNDSLAIHGWKLVRKEFWKLSTNVFISGFNLSASDKSDITVFTVDSYWQIFYAGAVTPYTNWPFSIVNRTIVSGDQNYEVTLLNNLNLQYQQIYKYADDQKIVWFYEAVIF